MLQRFNVLAVCLIAMIAWGCNEPVVFDPNSQDPPDPSNNGVNNEPDAGGDPADVATPSNNTPNNDEDVVTPPPGDAMTVIDPSIDTFRDVVMPILRAGCNGPICHATGPSNTRGYQVVLERDLSEEQLQENMDLTIAWVDFNNPVGSELLLQPLIDEGCCATHPGPFLNTESDDYRLLVEWIEDSVKVVEPEPDPNNMGAPDAGEPDAPEEPLEPPVPCDSFPEPSDLPGPMRYDPFQRLVNPMLVERCTRVGGCHALPGNGGGLWLLREEDECSVRWNFLTSRWFVAPERSDVLRSPLLERPLGQQEPNQLHGGAVVFRGQDDCGFVLLKQWLEGDLVNEPLPPICSEF